MSDSVTAFHRRRVASDDAARFAHLRFFDFSEAATDARAEIIAGLELPAASISPKYFYDALGSRLFEAICELPEYTLTRDEQSIFERDATRIAREIGPIDALIDLGAGNSEKAERLFRALAPAQYVAVDIAVDFLKTSLRHLADRHPELEVVGVAQDFTRSLRLPPPVRDARRLFFYPGSSIGNFGADAAAQFLARVHAQAAGGHLLLGADLVKDSAELEAAYDDALGVTAAFNLNVLAQANRLAGTDFEVADWRHVALFNSAESRVEMHLEARHRLVVRWAGGERHFEAGERIHTENSHKYTLESLRTLLESAGFHEVRVFADEQSRFVVALATG